MNDIWGESINDGSDFSNPKEKISGAKPVNRGFLRQVGRRLALCKRGADNQNLRRFRNIFGIEIRGGVSE
jgi:hypothetical protein